MNKTEALSICSDLLDATITLERLRVSCIEPKLIERAEHKTGTLIERLMSVTYCDSPRIVCDEALTSVGIDPKAPYAPPRMTAYALHSYNEWRKRVADESFPERTMPTDLAALIGA